MAGAHQPVRLHAEVHGQGPALLMLHGLFGSSRNWRSIQRKQADSRTVHALDLRNHGQSGWADSMSYSQMATDVMHYMDQQSIDRATVLGHSMGGKVAMAMAGQAPQRIQALVVVDIAPIRYALSHQGHLTAMRALDLQSVSSRQVADRMLADKVPDNAVRGFLLQNLVNARAPDATTRWQWRINLDVIEQSQSVLSEFDVAADEPAPSFPVAAIYGARSEYMEPPAQQALQDRYGNTLQWFPIAEAGHWVHAEQPAAFNDALQRFLRSIP